jgi:DNA-binding NtrC family response regulator
MGEDRKHRIFVVDDEELIASTLEAILGLQGFDARAFTVPLEALARAREHAPDMLISDVVMPGMSGIDLAIQFRRECPNCKVLLFSGQASTAGMLAKAMANGHHFEVLGKPIHPTDLLRKIGAVFAD